MLFSFDQIDVDCRGDVHCVRLKKRRLNENDQLRFGDEMAQLITEHGCRRLALSLGNDELDCLYSMFLGKLVATRRLMLQSGGHLHLCEVGPASLSVLTTCKLNELFEIHKDMDTAVKA